MGIIKLEEKREDAIMKFQHLLKVRTKKENLLQFMDGRTIVLSIDAVKLSKLVIVGFVKI
jgi:hypothetical protein